MEQTVKFVALFLGYCFKLGLLGQRIIFLQEGTPKFLLAFEMMKQNLDTNNAVLGINMIKIMKYGY